MIYGEREREREREREGGTGGETIGGCWDIGRRREQGRKRNRDVQCLRERARGRREGEVEEGITWFVSVETRL